MLPVNNATLNGDGTHWSLLVIHIDSNKNRFYHFDSIKGLNHGPALKLTKNVCSYLKLNDHEFVESPCPSQTNSYDCGLFVIASATILSLAFFC